jgi:UDP-N-acetyl-D-glucosamine/UDP-N-acetyl-D-galactosamine dehydrogenase
MINLYESILNKESKLSVIGLGYVGLPIAVAFARKSKVIGFDISNDKIALYSSGVDPTKEVGDQIVRNTAVEFTSDEKKLKECLFHIIAVPTPVNSDHTPDLFPIKSASKILGRNLIKGSIVVYESTVYPGVTEDICVPILEKESGLKCGIDFKVGYSPERINPGDKIHRLETIIKIVSGMDNDSLETIAKVYGLVVNAGVYKAKSIKIAEAAKVIENSQRDINIAFMNELSIIFNKMGIETRAVLEAANTKWNFLNFTPGLVGGHCIGVDPYYLTYKAEQLGYHSQIILAGRKINDDMGKYIVLNLIKLLIRADVSVKNARVVIFGFTFKENCPDSRNTRVIDIYNELREYNITPFVVDPQAHKEEVLHEYNLRLSSLDEISEIDAVIITVAHDDFKRFNLETLNSFYKKTKSSDRVIMDVKGILEKDVYETNGYIYFSL